MDIIDPSQIAEQTKRMQEEQAAPISTAEKKLSPLLDDADIEECKKLFAAPVDRQQELAIRLKTYIDFRIDLEIREEHIIKDSTRRFIELYNDLLDRIQKNLYGEKSVNLHLHKVSHDHISQLIQKHKKPYLNKDAVVADVVE